MLKFSFIKAKGLGFFFFLDRPGGRTLFFSVAFPTLASCLEGARLVIESCKDIRMFHLVSESGYHSRTEKRVYLFVIRDKKGNELVRSRSYFREEHRVTDIRFLRMNAGEMRFDKMSYTKPIVL